MHALFVKFQPEVSEEEFMKEIGPKMKAMRGADGLIMKMFVEPDDKHWGGLYLFTSREAADSYLSGEFFQGFSKSSVISNLEVQHWTVDDEPSKAFGTPSTPLAART